jgi:hypothetical protein
LPEYVAVTGYPPAGRLTEVWHDVAGSVTVHRVVVPEVNVTVPVAPAGRPEADRVTALPYVVDDGFALTVIV